MKKIITYKIEVAIKPEEDTESFSSYMEETISEITEVLEASDFHVCCSVDWKFDKTATEPVKFASFGQETNVHTGHCCVKHGCKYSDPQCPVENKKLLQEYPCEWCKEEEND